MNLQHLTSTACPECGARTKLIEQRDWHCNGHANERREYTCGKALSFSPNFMKSFEVGECRSSQKYKDKREHQKQLLITLRMEIDVSKADEDFKKRVLEQLRWMEPHA